MTRDRFRKLETISESAHTSDPGFGAALAFCFTLVWWLVPLVVHAQLSEHLGNFKSVQRTDFGLVIRAANGSVSLDAYSPSIIRVRIVRGEFGRDFSYAVVQQPQKLSSRFSEEPDQLSFSTQELSVVVSKKPVRLHFYTSDHRLVNEDDADLGVAWQGTEVTCFKKLFPDERFIGLGEKTGSLDRRGRSFVNWNTDHYAYGVEDDPLYVSTPFFIGLHDRLTYGIFFDNTRRTTFDFGSSSDNRFSSFSAPDGEMNYYFIGGSSVAAVLEGYTSLTGRMKLPPLWSLGFQQCRWSYFPDSEVLELARTFRRKNIPADVIYLDIHYMDAYKIFTWHPERFPHPKAMLDSLRAMGFHVVTIVDPGIKVEKGYFAYDEGVQNDYFIKYPNGENYVGSVWPGECHFPDFTNPQTRAWWGKSMSRLVETGVDGFWNDMNEPAVWGQKIPDLVRVNFDGDEATMKEAHNIYGMEMARSTYEGSEQLLNGKRPFVLTRAGYSGIQRYAAVWTGDNVPSDEHMLLAVRMVNSMGLSGIAFAGPDISGFAGDATSALFTRWLSIGTYTPFFRSHKQYGMKRHEPWSFGEEVEIQARSSIEQRYRLLPYIYSAFYQTSQTGLPVARTLAIDYSFDEHVFWSDFQNEYLFGDNLLVAPVASTENKLNVYLPEGGWYRLGSDRFYKGNATTVVEAPLNDLPVFVRAGGMIPIQSIVQNTGERASDTLQFHVYAGDHQTSFTYYEDDGTTRLYEQGTYHKRIVAFDPVKKHITFSSVEGTYGTKFTTINLVLHGFENVEKLTVNTKAMSPHSSGTTPRTKNIVFRNSSNEIVVKW